MKKNGKVELWRFIFSIAVLCFHVYKYLPGEEKFDGVVRLSFFSGGYLGVEFFFLLSGILMAYSVYRASERSRALSNGKSTTLFLKKKVSAIMPMHIAVFVVLFIASFIAKGWSIATAGTRLLESIPGLFFIQMSGVYGNYLNHIEWYLSAMLIAMLILYPLLRKWYSSFTHIIAPLLALLLIGYLSHEYRSLGGVKVWTALGSKALLRGISEIALGTVCFEVSRALKEKTMSGGSRALITTVETICLIAAVTLCIVTRDKKYDVYALGFMAVALTCAFTGQSYGASIFQNKVCAYLGKLSLPIYLVQLIPIMLVPMLAEALPMKAQMILTVIATLMLAAIFSAGNDLYFSWRKRRANRAAA